MIQLLYAADADQAAADVVDLGGRVLHVLTTRVLVADLPASVVPPSCTTEPPAELDEGSVRAAAAWAASRSKPRTGTIPWDAPGYEAPG